MIPASRFQILSVLPVELLTEILSYLTRQTDICAALLVTKQFYALLQPHLYKNIKLVTSISDGRLASFTNILDVPCTIYKSRAQQVAELSLTLERPLTNATGNPISMTNVYLPIYRLLTKLPNLSRLKLKINRGLTPYAFWRDIRVNDTPWPCIDELALDEDFQLSIRTLIFDVSQWPGACPANVFRDWLLTQDAVKRFEHLVESRPCKLLPTSFPNLHFLKVSASNFLLLVNDLVGPRPIAHLSIMGRIDDVSDSEAFRLPDAYGIVTVLSCSSEGSSSPCLRLAGHFRSLEWLNISYSPDVGHGTDHLDSLLHNLRSLANQPQTSRMLQALRCLRVTWSTANVIQDGSYDEPCLGIVADIFAQLTWLRCLEIKRDGMVSIRFDRKCTQRVVRWKCEESDVWCRDWEKDVVDADPDTL